MSSIRNAPDEVHSVVHDLLLFSKILDEIRENDEKFGSHDTTKLALKRCAEIMASLDAITGPLVAGLGSKSAFTRTLKGIETVRQADRVSYLRMTLQDLKATLILARQNSDGWVATVVSISIYNLIDVRTGECSICSLRSSMRPSRG